MWTCGKALFKPGHAYLSVLLSLIRDCFRLIEDLDQGSFVFSENCKRRIVSDPATTASLFFLHSFCLFAVSCHNERTVVHGVWGSGIPSTTWRRQTWQFLTHDWPRREGTLIWPGKRMWSVKLAKTLGPGRNNRTSFFFLCKSPRNQQYRSIRLLAARLKLGRGECGHFVYQQWV